MSTTHLHGYADGEQKAGEGAHAGQHDESLIRLPDCLQRVRLGRTAWLDMVRDKQAPQPVKIGRATLWVASEVQGFIAERIRLSRKG